MFRPGGSWASCWKSLLTGGPSIPTTDVPGTAISLALLVALSHPGHRMPHSETSRQLRRCRWGWALNEDVSSKRAVFNAICSIYRLMAAPASSRPHDKKRLYTDANTIHSVRYTDTVQSTLSNTQTLYQTEDISYTGLSELLQHFEAEERKNCKDNYDKSKKGVSQDRCDIVVPCVHLYSRNV